ncbi:MAG: helix-turn-helix transcriptional regulator [Methylophilaceae bacterium]
MSNTTAIETPVWIDTSELAQILGQAKNTIEIKRHLGEDLPPHYEISKKCVRYKLSEVNAWIESKRKVPAAVQLAERVGA